MLTNHNYIIQPVNFAQILNALEFLHFAKCSHHLAKVRGHPRHITPQYIII